MGKKILELKMHLGPLPSFPLKLSEEPSVQKKEKKEGKEEGRKEALCLYYFNKK